MAWWSCHHYHKGRVFFEGQQRKSLEAIVCLGGCVSLQYINDLGVGCKVMSLILCCAHILQCQW